MLLQLLLPLERLKEIKFTREFGSISTAFAHHSYALNISESLFLLLVTQEMNYATVAAAAKTSFEIKPRWSFFPHGSTKVCGLGIEPSKWKNISVVVSETIPTIQSFWRWIMWKIISVLVLRCIFHRRQKSRFVNFINCKLFVLVCLIFCFYNSMIFCIAAAAAATLTLFRTMRQVITVSFSLFQRWRGRK